MKLFSSTFIFIFILLVAPSVFAIDVTLYSPAVTGCDSSATTNNVQSKRLSNRMNMIGWDSVLYMFTHSANTTRTVYSSNGGTTWTHTTYSNGNNSVSQPFWAYGDSLYGHTFGSASSASEGNNRKFRKWRKFTEVLYDTITHPLMKGDNTHNTFGGVRLTTGSYMALWVAENGTTDTVLLVQTNGDPTQSSTWTTIDSAAWTGSKWGDGQQEFSPAPDINGMFWMDKNDDMYFADTIGGLDTLSTSVTGATLNPTDLGSFPALGYSIRFIRDSFILIAYQDNGGTLYARPYHISKAGTGGTSFDTLIPDAAAQTLEADANLPALPASGAASYLCATPDPWIVSLPGTDTVYCLYWYWQDQAKLDSADLVYKVSTDKGATWGSRTTIAAAATIKPQNNKMALFGVPYAKYNNGVTELFAAWSDSMTVTDQDSVNIMKIKIGADLGGGTPSLPALGHGPGTSPTGHSPSGVTQGHKP